MHAAEKLCGKVFVREFFLCPKIQTKPGTEFSIHSKQIQWGIFFPANVIHPITLMLNSN